MFRSVVRRNTAHDHSFNCGEGGQGGGDGGGMGGSGESGGGMGGDSDQ